MSTLPPDVRRILEEQGLLQPDGTTESLQDEVNRDLEDMGLLPKKDEGLDVFQPVRTLFGATMGAGGMALGAFAPEQYAAARSELEKAHGITPTSPWYERTEALPGLGDVAAQFVPQDVRESRLGTALGPVARLGGNILGDPTTYTPFVLGKATGAIARSVPEAGALIGRSAEAELARRAALSAAPLAEGALGPGGQVLRDAAAAARATEGADIAKAVMQHGNLAQRAGYFGGAAIQNAEPAVLGTAAALAYGPEAVKGAYEGWKEAFSGATTEPVLDTAAQTANALLQTGLSALMAHGLISGAEAASRFQRHLEAQRPADVRAAVEQVGGRVAGAVEEAVRPPVVEPAVGEPTILSVLQGVETAPRPLVNEPTIEPPIRAPEVVEPPILARAPEPIPEPAPPGAASTAQLAEPRVVAEPPARPAEAVPEVIPVREPLAVRPELPVEPRAAEPAVSTLPVEGAASVGKVAVEGPTKPAAEGAPLELTREFVDGLLKGDDALASDPTVGGVVRSIFGFGTKGRAGRPDRMANLTTILTDVKERGALARKLEELKAEAAAKGDELDPARVRALIGDASRNRGLLKEEATRNVKETARFETAQAKVEAGAPLPVGKIEAPRAAVRGHYDYLKEQLAAEGPLKQAGLKSVRELADALPLEQLNLRKGYVEAFKDYVSARDRGVDHAGAIEFARTEQVARDPEKKARWGSQQAAVNAINQVFREADALQKRRGVVPVGAARGQVEGVREPTPEEVEILARSRNAVVDELKQARDKNDNDGLVTALGRTLSYLDHRKLYSVPPSNKILMTELKATAEKLGVSHRKQNAGELARDIINKLGKTVTEVKPIVQEALAPVMKAEVARVREAKKEGGRGPGGARSLPTHPSRPGHGWFELSNKTQLQHLESEGSVKITKFDGANLDGVKQDLGALREDPDVKIIDAGDLPNKALDGLLDPAEGRLPAFVEDPDAPAGLDRLVRMDPKQDRIAEMEARAEFGIPPSWLAPGRASDPDVRTLSWFKEGKTTLESKPFMDKLKGQLKAAGIKGLTGIGEVGAGTYHVVFDLKGAKDAKGNDVVIRVGKAPYLPLITPEQRALEAPVLAHGKVTEGVAPLFYTVHQKGIVSPDVFSRPISQIDETGRLTKTLTMLSRPGAEQVVGPEKFDQALHDRLWSKALKTNRIPPGIALQEVFEDINLLLQKAVRRDLLVSTDVTAGLGYAPRAQFAYIPVDNLDTLGVGRVGADRQAWQLVSVDRGLLTPSHDMASRDPLWGQFHAENRLALKAAEPESRLSLDERMRQIAHYDEDSINAAVLADGLWNANHDRVASEDFVTRHGELGGGAAGALKGIVADLTRTVNDQLPEGDRRLNVEYRGLTSSPFLSGLYHERLGTDETAHVYSNVAEAVNAAGGSYERAIENMLDTVLHEVTHNKSKGHGSEFQTFSEYKRNVLTAANKLDEYRAQLKAAFSEEQFRAVKEGLVPEFQRMRRAHGNRAGASWIDAQRRETAVEGVPAGAVEGRAPPVTDQLGRGEEGAPLDLRGGQEPGGVVPGGGGVETGGVRPTTAVGAAPAEGLAASEAARPATGGDPLQAIKERIAEYGARPTTEEGAKKLLTDIVEASNRAGIPPNFDSLHLRAWDLAGDLLSVLHPKDVEARAQSLPYPTKEGQMKGAINMLHYVDLPVETKARFQLWYELTKGLWPADRPQRWEDVGKDVQDLLGLHTPEQWAFHFRNQKGGPTAKEILLMRQVSNELANKVNRAEERLYDAMATNPNITPEELEKLQHEVNLANQGAVEGGLMMAEGGTKLGRGLAIMRMDIRNANPQLAFQANLKAGIRERMQTRFKGNAAAAEEATNKLYNQFMEIRNSPNPDWAEFQKAYRAVMGSRLWPEKILEFYKAGLLGWPSRVANMTSNGLLRGVRMVEDAVAAGLDAAQSKLTGKERERYLGEGSASMLALRRSWAEAIPEWWQEMKRNAMLQPDDMLKALDKGSLMEDLLQGPGAISGRKGEFIRFHLKGMGADDAFAKHFVKTDSLYRQIYRKIRESDKNFPRRGGESIAQAVERNYTEHMNNWRQAVDGSPAYDYGKVKLWSPMMDQAKKDAERETFQAQLGPTAQAGQSFLRNNPIFQIFIPFYRTPVNITKETLVRTPLGFLNTAKKWKDLSPLERTGELSKNITGTLLGAGALAYAMADGASGGGPLDPDERAMLETTGWQPYSVKVGNNYVSYQRLEPLASLLGVASDAAEGLRNGDFQSARTGFMRVLQSTAENITNKTFLSGLDALSSAISHPNEFGNSFVKRMQSSIIPNSLGFVPVSGLARALDSTYRQSEPMSMSAFYQKLPFLSSTLEPQYSPSGAERERPGTPFEQLFSPFARKEQELGAARIGAEEVVRLAASPKAPRKYWLAPGGLRVDFMPEERKSMALAMEAATKFIGDRLIRDPNYLALPDNEMDPKFSYGRKTKETVIKDVYGRYREGVMKQIKPHLVARGRKKVREGQS